MAKRKPIERIRSVTGCDFFGGDITDTVRRACGDDSNIVVMLTTEDTPKSAIDSILVDCKVHRYSDPEKFKETIFKNYQHRNWRVMSTIKDFDNVAVFLKELLVLMGSNQPYPIKHRDFIWVLRIPKDVSMEYTKTAILPSKYLNVIQVAKLGLIFNDERHVLECIHSSTIPSFKNHYWTVKREIEDVK